jgi:hypothetical protein
MESDLGGVPKTLRGAPESNGTDPVAPPPYTAPVSVVTVAAHDEQIAALTEIVMVQREQLDKAIRLLALATLVLLLGAAVLTREAGRRPRSAGGGVVDAVEGPRV